MIYQVISPEPNLRFLQAGPQFFRNYKVNSINFQNVIIHLQKGLWGPKTSFETSEFYLSYQAISPEHSLIFSKT